MKMQEPRYVANLLISIETMSLGDAQDFSDKILAVAGVEEVVLRHEDAVLYLKVDNQKLDQAQLQTLMNTHIHEYEPAI